MTGAGRLSPDPQPVTEIRSTLSLYRGRCGVSPQKGSAETLGSAAGEGFPPYRKSRFGDVSVIARSEEVRGKIVDYLCRFSASPEALLLLEIDRRNHMNELIIGVERQYGLGVRPART